MKQADIDFLRELEQKDNLSGCENAEKEESGTAGGEEEGVNDVRYSNPRKLHWIPDLDCPSCNGDVNSWDKRCSRALGYQSIVCEACICKEYGVTADELRRTMEEHFGLIPCPGI